MDFFGRLLSETLGWPLFVGTPTGECDTVLIVGMYDSPSYAHTLDCTKRAKRRVIYFCGSDVLVANPAMMPDATYLCETQGIRQELRDKGITASVIPFPTRLHLPVEPWPEKPAVAFYGGNDPRKYGVGFMQILDAAHPDIDFYYYTAGQYPESAMAGLAALVTVYVRLTTHDGAAASSREFAEGGRRVITTQDMPHTYLVSRSDPAGFVETFERCLAAEGPDMEAAEYYAKMNDPARFVADIQAVIA
jgi:hypothetical protein